MKVAEQPLVTAIMPLKYYDTDFLEKSVASILNQSCRDWRLVIVVEPADWDLFQGLLQNELQDPRIDMVRMTGRPFTGSINTGMRIARSEFVALLFADDMWDARAVETLHLYIREFPRIDVFSSAKVIIDEQDQVISSVLYRKPFDSLDRFKSGSPVGHLLCWRRATGLAVGGIDESIIRGPDDYDFPWTLAEYGASFMPVNESLYLMRNHCRIHRLTTHTPRTRIKRDLRKILKKHGVGPFERWRIVHRKCTKGTAGNQAIYRSTLDRWLCKILGIDGKTRWKPQTYR